MLGDSIRYRRRQMILAHNIHKGSRKSVCPWMKKPHKFNPSIRCHGENESSYFSAGWWCIHEYVFTYNHLLVCLVAARYRNTLEPILGRIFEEVIWFSCLSRVSKKTLLVKDESSKNAWCLTRVETCLFHSHFFFIFRVQQNASYSISILPGF